jgi:hypothetical protein
MASNSELFFGLVIAAVFLSAIHGWFSDKSKELKEDEFNRELRKELDDEKNEHQKIIVEKNKEIERRIDQINALNNKLNKELEENFSVKNKELEKRMAYVSNLHNQFQASYIHGRQWLAEFIAEADKVLDDSIESALINKKYPALKAAEEVASARAEKRRFKEQLKLLEYQLKSYKEYFPFLEEYEDVILDEGIPLVPNHNNIDALESADPVLLYVPKAEYEGLTSTMRNQLALDRYKNRPLSKAAIGRFYERYLGYLYERDGWLVDYHGIIEGFEDLGRDLICRKGNQILIIQAKCWSAEKVIHEKHLFQLFGTTQLFLMNQRQNGRTGEDVFPMFITTTKLSSVAKEAAKWLNIDFREDFQLDKTYPMIKCNINQSSKEKIYHLPFDQQYDRTKIVLELDEFYAASVTEAEERGFRRAFRYHGNN